MMSRLPSTVALIEIALVQDLDVQPHRFDERRDYIGSMVLHIDFFSKKKVISNVLSSCDVCFSIK